MNNKNNNEYLNIDKTIDKEFVKRLRIKLGMSQSVFASLLGVTKKTVEKWEQGVNPVKGCSARLLFMISKDPMLIRNFYKEALDTEEKNY